MPLFHLTWTPPSVDTVGEPITLTEQRLYKNGVLHSSMIPGAVQRDVTVNPGETAVFDVRALGPAGEGPPGNEITITVASGIPAPIVNLQSTPL